MGNGERSDLCLFIESLGADQWLKPGEAFTVGPNPVWFEAFVSNQTASPCGSTRTVTRQCAGQLHSGWCRRHSHGLRAPGGLRLNASR